MLPALQTITVLVHLEGFGLCKAEGRAGIWWWSLGDWSFFQPPSGPDMGKLVGRWPFRCHQSPELLSHRCLSGAEAPLKGVGFGYSVCMEAMTGVSGFYDLPGGGVEVPSSPKRAQHPCLHAARLQGPG